MLKEYFKKVYINNNEIYNLIEEFPIEIINKLSIDKYNPDTLPNFIFLNSSILVPYLINNNYHLLENILTDYRIFKNITNKTYELCLEAVKKDGRNIQYVNLEFKTRELCIEALNNNCDLLFINNKTDEYCKIALSKSYMQLISISNPSDEICKYAISINGNSIFYINKNKINIELYKLAIEDPKIVLLGHFHYPEEALIHFIHLYSSNYEKYKDSFIKNVKSILSLYTKVDIMLIELDESLIEKILVISNELYDYIYNNKPHLLDIINSYSLSIENIIRTLELYPEYIYKLDKTKFFIISNMKKKISVSELSEEEKWSYIIDDPFLISEIINPSSELLNLAISLNPNTLEYITKYQTLELCLKAVKLNPDTIRYAKFQNKLMQEISYNYDNNNIYNFDKKLGITIDEIYKYMNDNSKYICFVFKSIVYIKDNDLKLKLNLVLSEYILDNKLMNLFDYLIQKEEYLWKALKICPKYINSINNPTIEMIDYIYELDERSNDKLLDNYNINHINIAYHLLKKDILFIKNIDGILLNRMKGEKLI